MVENCETSKLNIFVKLITLSFKKLQAQNINTKLKIKILQCALCHPHTHHIDSICSKKMKKNGELYSYYSQYYYKKFIINKSPRAQEC
jgi:hypothetical protein